MTHELPTLTIDELAAIFRRVPLTMERTWKRWRLKYGFPDPLPDQKPRLWSRDAVLTWIADPKGYGYVTKFAPPRPGEAPAELVAHVRNRLEEKYGAAA